MTRIIITCLILILLTSCGTDFAVRKYTEGRFYEHSNKNEQKKIFGTSLVVNKYKEGSFNKRIDNTEQEKLIKDTIFIKKLKKGSTIVTRIKSKGPDITIDVDENNIPLIKHNIDTNKLSSTEEKQKIAMIKSIEKHAKISRVIFWLPIIGFIHNASYLKKANKIESKYTVDLTTEKGILRTSLLFSIPFLLIGIVFVLFLFLGALAGVAVLG